MTTDDPDAMDYDGSSSDLYSDPGAGLSKEREEDRPRDAQQGAAAADTATSMKMVATQETSNPQPGPSNKRSRDDEGDSNGSEGHDQARRKVDHTARRAKSGSGLSLGLPFAAWRRICSLLTPLDLASLMMVDRSFCDLLREHRPMKTGLSSSTSFPSTGRFSVIAAKLWISCRKAMFPLMPDPPSDCSESTLWNLLLGKSCTFCSSHQSGSRSQENLDNPSVIWPFLARLCETCIGEQTVEEASLFFSDASILIPLLPCAFLGDDKKMIPSILLKENSTIVQNQDIRKVYYKPHMDGFQQQMPEGEKLGRISKARFEFLKDQNVLRREQTQIWEQWILDGGDEQLKDIYSGSRTEGSRDLGTAKPSSRRATESQTNSTMPSTNSEKNTSRQDLLTRLSEYADEGIRNTWAAGHGVNADSAPLFAADILTYVRKRYLSTMMLEEHLRDENDPKSTTQHRTLFLSDMKWIFDHKVKPLTDPIRKDLFLCNGCDSNNKYYGFEAVIQHYAVKHTTNFTVGNTSVHWQLAEWPELCPFVPQPDNRRPGHGPSTSGSDSTVYHRPFPVPLTSAQGVRLQTQQSPGPYLETGAHGTPVNSQGGPFQPPGFAFAIATSPFSGNGQMPFARPGTFTPLSSHGWPLPPYRATFSPAAPGSQALVPTSPQPPIGDSVYDYARALQSSLAQHTLVHAPAGMNLYHSQRDFVAKIARETWDRTSGIKDIPPSVRIHVVIVHVVSLFRTNFRNDPNLDLFTDCILHHTNLLPVRNAGGLACKACVLSDEATDDGPSHSSAIVSPLSSSVSVKLGGRKLYPFHSLLQHFKSVHVEQPLTYQATAAANNDNPRTPPSQSTRPDWKVDMIELPDAGLIRGLSTAQGMDATKLSYIATAFRDIFESASPMSDVRAVNDEEYDPRNPGLFLQTRYSNRSNPPRGVDASSMSEGSRPRSLAGGSTATRPNTSSVSHRGETGFLPPGSVSDEAVHSSARSEDAHSGIHDIERDHQPAAFYVKQEPGEGYSPSQYPPAPVFFYAPYDQPSDYRRGSLQHTQGQTGPDTQAFEGRWRMSTAGGSSTRAALESVYYGPGAVMPGLRQPVPPPEYVYMQIPNPAFKAGSSQDEDRAARDYPEFAMWRGQPAPHELYGQGEQRPPPHDAQARQSGQHQRGRF